MVSDDVVLGAGLEVVVVPLPVVTHGHDGVRLGTGMVILPAAWTAVATPPVFPRGAVEVIGEPVIADTTPGVQGLTPRRAVESRLIFADVSQVKAVVYQDDELIGAQVEHFLRDIIHGRLAWKPRVLAPRVQYVSQAATY